METVFVASSGQWEPGKYFNARNFKKHQETLQAREALREMLGGVGSQEVGSQKAGVHVHRKPEPVTETLYAQQPQQVLADLVIQLKDELCQDRPIPAKRLALARILQSLSDLHQVIAADDPSRRLAEDLTVEAERALTATNAVSAPASAPASNPVLRLPENTVDTCPCSLSQAFYLLLHTFLLAADHFQRRPVHGGHDITVVSLFLVMSIHILGSLTQWASNALLKLLPLVWRLCFLSRAAAQELSPMEQRLIREFPKSITPLRRLFDMDLHLITFATCPKCLAIHPPSTPGDARVSNSPLRCLATRFGNPPCNTVLVKFTSTEGNTTLSPIRPFHYQDMKKWVGRFLCRPGIEDAIESSWERSYVDDELDDVLQGSIIQTLVGADGERYARNPPSGELHTVWLIFVDWWNPWTNKIAGKKASVGLILMVCLNLPPKLRKLHTYIV